MHAAAFLNGAQPAPLPRATALGSLCHYISAAEAKNYQPANITFDLLPSLEEETKKKMKHDKKARHAEVCRRAQAALEEYRAVQV